MTQAERYLRNEINVIEKDCQEKYISPREWIERYAAEYHRVYWNGSIHKSNSDKLLSFTIVR